ncbi:MAG: DUF169 domain-containing protein [Deltaproteobacteria bacterium]|nr:DUF169 domain-containing protein [Deltaproteobacteria bacterium]
MYALTFLEIISLELVVAEAERLGVMPIDEIDMLEGKKEMDYEKYSEIIMKMVMPQSFPIGIKILRKGDPFPDGVVRPGKFAIKVALCQWTNLARRWGWVVGAMAEDINCIPCLVGFKKLKNKSDFAQFALDMGYFDSLEPAADLVEQLELLKPGEVKGIVAFPLAKAPVSPDLLVIYGTPAQMSRLTYAYTPIAIHV